MIALRIAACGTMRTILTADVLTRPFGHSAAVIPQPTCACLLVVPLPREGAAVVG